jgi:hypothetical protein
MLRVWLTLAIAFLIVVSRRPDALFHPQFWAEDGAVWYADAYNKGIGTLLRPHDSYLQTLPRLVALASQWVPLRLAPFLFNVLALIIQALPACFAVSDRAAPFGSFRQRLLFAFLYLALPNSGELHGNLTGAQWHLALLSLLIVFGKPASTSAGRWLDFAVVLLSGLTGPFIILTAPAALFLYMKERPYRSNLVLIAAIACAMIQATAVVGTSNAIRNERIGSATVGAFAAILAKQVFGAALLGRRTLMRLSFDSVWPAALAVAASGMALELYVLAKAPLRWKLFVAFSAAILAASLAYPMAPPPQWSVLGSAGGIRYWFFPMLAFILSILWLLQGSGPPFLRTLGRVLLAVMTVGVVQDWGHPRFIDQHFCAYADKFSRVAPGTRLTIPLNPQGWSMDLIKK